MKPKVSVLISIYNGESTIERSIRSILNQTFSDFEIIIVNDGSTDETESLIKRFTDSRIRLINLAHVGLPKALNFGLNFCKGKYIARMDADDWSHPNRLALQVDFLERNKHIDVVSCLVEYGGDRTKNLGYALHVDWLNKLLLHDDIKCKRFEDSPVANPSCMFKKSLISRYGKYRESDIPEDYEFWLRLLHEGIVFHKINQTLFKWADLPHRITRTSDAYNTENFLEVKTEYLSYWIDQKYSHKPHIYVFGTGKVVKNKTASLRKYGLGVSKYLEVKPPPYADSDKLYYKNLPGPTPETLVLSYIGDRQGKERVIDYLNQRGYVEGENFFMMA